jgi:cell division protein FtsN
MLGQNGSSRLDTVLKMLLIAFVSLLAFSSGVYFGKEMSDSEYQLKSLEKDFNDNEKVAAEDSHEGEEAANPQDAMIDEEIAALSNKYMNGAGEVEDDGDEQAARDVASADETANHAAPTQHESAHREAAAPQPAHHEPAHKQEHKKSHDKAPAAAKEQPAAHTGDHASNETAPIRKGGVDLSEVKKVAERVANNEVPSVPAKAKKENRRPASLPKIAAATASAEYTVQVASYTSEKEAQAHAAELVKKGFPAYPLEASIKGKTWYRVSVGSFKSQKEASEYRAQLVKQAGVASPIVQKIDR